MQKIVFLINILIFFTACKNNGDTSEPIKTENQTQKMVSVTYAEGFEIEELGNFKVITLKKPWPGTDKTFKYALVKKNTPIKNPENSVSYTHLTLPTICSV